MYNQTIIKPRVQVELASQAPAIKSGKEEFTVNVTSNLAYLFVQTLVSLWYTPYLIRHLGIAAYGIVPLATSITAYVSLVTYSFNSAVSRFLIIDLAKRDERKSNATFNTAFFGIAGLVAILIPFTLVFSVVFPQVFHVPPGFEVDATWQFLLVSTAFSVSLIASNFSVSAYAHSKFLLANIVRFIELLARVGLVVALFYLFPPHLWHVGIGILVAALVTLSGHFLLWRKLTPELSVQSRLFDRSRFRALMGMGSWSTVERTGFLLLNNTNLMIVNLAFDAATTGAYGSLMQFPTLVDSAATTAISVIYPSILKKYAQGDLAGLKRLVSQAVKLLGWLIALPVGLLCGLSRPLLSAWLGPSFQNFDILLIIMVIHLTVNLAIIPLGHVQNAYNRVRWPGIVTLVTGAVNLVLAISLARWGPWGVLGVAMAGATASTLRSILFMPLYTAHIMQQRWWVFLPSLSVSIVGTAFVGMMAYGVAVLWAPAGWFALGISAATVSLLYGVCMFFLGLNRGDWELINGLVPAPMRQKLTWFLLKTKRIEVETSSVG